MVCVFNNSKYTRWYYQIILHASTQRRTKKESYFETHHILPKSLGGTNEKYNLVLLTAREHFICHFLLTKMVAKSQKNYHEILCAFILMKGKNAKQSRYMNSRLYEAVKPVYSAAKSSLRKGVKLSEEHRRKISETMKKNYRYREKVFSTEARRKISEKAKNRIRRPFTEAEKQQISASMKAFHSRRRQQIQV
jgi:hypothetical protein